LPLPSSPHWAPTITAVLPFFNLSSNREIPAGRCLRCARGRTLLARRDGFAKNYWSKSGEDVYELSYRVRTANGNERAHVVDQFNARKKGTMNEKRDWKIPPSCNFASFAGMAINEPPAQRILFQVR
jgi:hypothetical protein